MFLRGVLLLAGIVGFVGNSSAQKKASSEEWEQIFNGKDLKGWDIKIAGVPLNENYKNTFRVQDGMLRVSYDDYKDFDGKYGHIYYNKPFSFYKIRFDYRFTGDQVAGGASWNVRNSGVMLHSQSAQSLTFNQTFPVSLEFQTLGGLGGNTTRHTGNLCTPGTQVYVLNKADNRHCVDSESKTFHGDQWVSAEAIVYGDSLIHHLIAGDTVLTYTHLQVGGGFVSKDHDWKAGGFDNGPEWEKRANTPLGTGYIALQAESHPIDFRNISVLNLEGCMDPKAVNYKSYYVKANNGKCVYVKGKRKK